MSTSGGGRPSRDRSKPEAFEAGAAPPPSVLAARHKKRLTTGDDDGSLSGGSGRTRRTASPRARSASEGGPTPSEAGASMISDGEASWDGNDDGTEDDEFVVAVGHDENDEGADDDDMETFEQELKRTPLSPNSVRLEIDNLKAESAVPIEAVLASYNSGNGVGGGERPIATGDDDDDGDGSDSSDSDYDSSESTSSEDRDDLGGVGGASMQPAVKHEYANAGPASNLTHCQLVDVTKPIQSSNLSLPSVSEVTYESALAEGERIRHEDFVFDKAWFVLQRPPKTLPRPKFPEPARNKTHWDHLLEEMKWLAGDFVRERKFRQKLAKKAAYAVQKSDLDLESRVLKAARDEQMHQRKHARWIGNEVIRFWMKVEKVVRFKAQSVVDAKRKTVMDKHLDFMLAQTERYSTMLATKLTGIDEEPNEGSQGVSQCLNPTKPLAFDDASTEKTLSLPGAPDSGGYAKIAVEPGTSSDRDREDEDEFVVGDDEMEETDDEQTLEEEMRAAEAEDGEDAAALEQEGLAADAEVPIETLLRRYREMEAAEAAANAKEEQSEEKETEEEDDDKEATFADIDEDDVVAKHGSHKKGSNESADDDENEFTVGDEDLDEDDEETLEEELRAAAREDVGDDGAAEAANLAADAEVPIEELMRMYREMEAAHEASTGAGVDEANEDEDEQSDEFDEDLEEEQGDDDDDDDDDEPGVASLVDAGDTELTAEEKAASDARRRVLDSLAGDATALQPKGHTLDSESAKNCRVPFLLKHTLREYQHVGLNWLVSCYDKALNGILADEMGLGKTIQTIALLAYLACECGIWGPHLIVVPTSVMLNWEVEFKKWAPAFKLLTYFGTAKERKLKRQGWSKPNSFHVCITTYRLITQDARVFRRKKWKYLILDEAHMIKNWRSQRWQTLLNFNSKRRLLITGTPLQNDLMELWSLMHFLMPHVFQSHSEFKNWFSSPLTGQVEGGGGVNMDLVSRLHGVLRPFLLRRLKSEVEKNLPGKVEHVVHCGLSKRQRRLYEEYMASSDTSTTLTSGNLLGIINCLMQLRKVCNHPDLFAGRPIVSAFDMPSPLALAVPSAVAKLAAETSLDPLSITKTFAPRGMHLLSLEDTNFASAFAFGGGERWSCEQASRRRVASEVVRRYLSGDGDDVSVSSDKKHLVTGRMTPSCESAAQLFLEVKRARARVERNAVARRIAANADAAADRVPVYGVDLRRAVLVHCQARDCHETANAFGAGPFAVAPALLELIKPPARRVIESDDLIATFVFAIPKARARAPEMVCASRSSAMSLTLGIQNAWSQHVGWQALAPLRHAQVRRQLFFPDRRLVQFDCGKLQALAQLLRTLKSGGHKVLIFTQMTKMLDILEQFLNLYGYAYCRLDGSTRPEQRQILTQRFNTDNRLFAFILSTRSGGFGINLTGADTVVFYDSDWNPAMDAQAQDRAHRIGQTREVHIYRMVCKGTIEENILKKSMQKRELDHFAIQRGNFTTEHFTGKKAVGGSGGGGNAPNADDGGGAPQKEVVVGGEQGAAAMSIFDRAMSRAVVKPAAAAADDANKAGPSKTAANDDDDDEVARLMDDAQDDADKVAASNALREENDDAAEFGDDIAEKIGDLDDDEVERKPSVSDLKTLSGGSGDDDVPGETKIGGPPETPTATDANQTLSLTRVNTSLAGDDAYAEEMMKKVQLSASRGESLSSQLKPVERYAVKYLEETVRILDDAGDTAAAAIADFEEKEWELEQIEKQKAAAEAAEDDDELIIEGWETGNADDEYRRNVDEARAAEQARAEYERLEQERWDAMYAVPSVEALKAEAEAEELKDKAAYSAYASTAAGDPFVGVPRRARSDSPAAPAAGGAPLRVLFRLSAKPTSGAAGAPGTSTAGPSGLSRASADGGDALADSRKEKDPNDSKKTKKHKRKRDGETQEERDTRRRLRRLSKEGAGDGDREFPDGIAGSGQTHRGAAFASPNGGGKVSSVSPHHSADGVARSPLPGVPSPSATSTWKLGEDAVLCALVDEFGGASWDLASGALGYDAALCKDRFRKIVASRAARLGNVVNTNSPGNSAQQLRVTPDVTKALFRATANEAFGLGGGGGTVPVQDAPEPALELRSDVKMARSRLASEGGVALAKKDVADAAKRFLAKTKK